ncbi:hypothetical protein P4S64_00790 [Vibrio sp. M60_M31a]
MSCGVYGYPPHEAAEAALSVCQRPKYHSLQMHFYLFSDEMLRIWQQALAAYQ